MNKENLLEELSALFREVLGNNTITLADETTANDVDGWTSLTHMVLISEIEKKYDIHFGLREIIKFKNVGDLVNTVINKLK
jgi:acyl carrier protein